MAAHFAHSDPVHPELDPEHAPEREGFLHETLTLLDRRAQRLCFEGLAVPVAWRRFGAGTPVVLLHGGHGRWSHWVRNIEALARRHTVWVPDLPGYGDSAVPLLPTLESLTDSLAESLEALKLEALIDPAGSLSVVGFSFGSLVAAELSRRCPGIGQLILLGPAGHGVARRPRGTLRNWRFAARDASPSVLRAVMRHNLEVHMLHRPQAVDDLALAVHTDACLRTRFRSKDVSRSGSLGARLSGYPGLVKLAFGEHDVTLDPAQALQRLAETVAVSASATIPDAGHWVQYEQADRVNDLLLAWLSPSGD